MQHIFILGSRGLPAQYGGFETFVEQLVTHQQSPKIKYHVACLASTEAYQHFDYEGADCFNICPPNIGPARVIAYDVLALNYCLKLVKEQEIPHPIFYILGNTIGAMISHFQKKIKKVGGLLYVNPDGLEWKRSKWSRPVQQYLKFSEYQMARYADLIIADNEGIENYIQREYHQAQTKYIAYGTDTSPLSLTKDDVIVQDYFQKYSMTENEYYLIVGRFVPENNYETMIREFMKSKTQRDLIIICNHEGNAYFEQLRRKTRFDLDSRIKFVGTVYHDELLKYIRAHAKAYIHGHEVGGTNPGLLEALSQTEVNLVLNVVFNQKVADDGALYWTKNEGDLAALIEEVDQISFESTLGNQAKTIVCECYTWQKIVGEYEELFLDESKHPVIHL